MIVRLSVVQIRTVVDSNWRFDNLCGSHFRIQSNGITSVDGILKTLCWLLTWLVNFYLTVAMFLDTVLTDEEQKISMFLKQTRKHCEKNHGNTSRKEKAYHL